MDIVKDLRPFPEVAKDAIGFTRGNSRRRLPANRNPRLRWEILVQGVDFLKRIELYEIRRSGPS
jgi:hypothetical protein